MQAKETAKMKIGIKTIILTSKKTQFVIFNRVRTFNKQIPHTEWKSLTTWKKAYKNLHIYKELIKMTFPSKHDIIVLNGSLTFRIN